MERGLFGRFRRVREGTPHQSTDHSFSREEIIFQRVAEHNSRIDIAQTRYEAEYRQLSERPDWAEIQPIVEGFVYAAEVERDGIWITSIIEAKGNLLNAWDLVDAKLQAKRDSYLKDKSNT